MHRVSIRAAAHLAVSALVCALIAGCASTPEPKPRWTDAPEETSAPLFATDEEAVAAAEAAYGAYQAAFNVVAASGGRETAGLDSVADGAALERALSDARDYRDGGLHSTGTVSFVTHKAQSLKYRNPERTALTLYVCDDVSEAELWGANGESLTLADRKVRVPFEITVAQIPTKGLVLISKVFWKGDDFCSAP